jgi:hypothetical protein
MSDFIGQLFGFNLAVKWLADELLFCCKHSWLPNRLQFSSASSPDGALSSSDRSSRCSGSASWRRSRDCPDWALTDPME